MSPVRKKRSSLWICGLAAVAALLAPLNAWADTAASGLRAAEHPDGITRLVVDLSKSVSFTTHLAEQPYRIVVDTERLNWTSHPSLGHVVGPINDVGYNDDKTNGHLTIKLSRPADIKTAFIMSPRENAGWRLVIDIKNTTKQDFAAQLPPPPHQTPVAAAVAVPAVEKPKAEPAAPIIITSPAAVMAPAAVKPAEPPPLIVTQTSKGLSPSLTAPLPPPLPAPPQPVAAAAPEPMAPPPQAPQQQQEAAVKAAAPAPADKPHKHDKDKDNRQIIVLDPGHGGVDPGATGVSGIYEKYITYSMARELQQQLEKTGHYKVHLTRDRDVFIPLRDRTAIARQLNADLFISLHADVVSDADIRGLSVYTLSQNASDTEAQALADKENKSDLIAGIDLSHETADVTNILIDLAQRETMNRSAGFAGEIVEELGRETPLLTNTHRFAGFAVLKSPDVPAVLIEMGYLSNPIDEKNLRQPEYRAKLAHAISRAVDRYFLQGQKAKRP